MTWRPLDFKSQLWLQNICLNLHQLPYVLSCCWNNAQLHHCFQHYQIGNSCWKNHSRCWICAFFKCWAFTLYHFSCLHHPSKVLIKRHSTVDYFCKTKHLPTAWNKWFNHFVMDGTPRKHLCDFFCLLIVVVFSAGCMLSLKDCHATVEIGQSVEIDTTANDGKCIGQLFVLCKRWKSNISPTIWTNNYYSEIGPLQPKRCKDFERACKIS